MSISKEFMDTVASGNVLRTRIILSNYMVVDPAFREFDEALKYALEFMTDLVEPHDGENLNYNMTEWTKEYFNKESTNLVDNFSRERIDLLRCMCRHLYKGSASGKSHKMVASGFASSDNTSVHDGKRSVSKKQAGAVAAGTGAIVAVAGLAVSSTPVAIAGAVVAVAGGILFLSDK